MRDALQVGDIVRTIDGDSEMLLIDQDVDATLENGERMWFGIWESGNRLHQDLYPESQLILVRKERRRIPRRGILPIPVRPLAAP